MSALGKLVAAVALDAAEFIQGADKAKLTAASLATDVDKQLRGIENSVKSTMTGIAAAVAAGFGISALKSQFDAYVEGAVKLEEFAGKAGLTIEKMSQLASVGKLSKTSIEDIAAAMEKLSRGVVNATGDTQGAGRALAFLGVNAFDASGRLRDAGTLTELVAQKLATMADGAGKTALLMDLYGKSGANLLPMLKDLAEFGTKNATITEAQAKVAKDYEQNLVRLGIAHSALTKIISSEVLPVADAVVKSLLSLSTQTGGVRDQAQALAQDGSIRQFAMIAVQSIGFVVNAGDGARRMFQMIGEDIAYLVAKSMNSLSTAMTAGAYFAIGMYGRAWQEMKDGATRDAAIVEGHAQNLRDLFEKPLAGSQFVKSVETNLAAVDAKMGEHGKTVTATADGYKKFREDTKVASDAVDAFADSLGKTTAKMQANLDSLRLYGIATKETAVAQLQFELAEGKVGEALQKRAKANQAAAEAEVEYLQYLAQHKDATEAALESEQKYVEVVKAHNEALAKGLDGLQDAIQKEKDRIATYGMATDAVTAYTIAELELQLASLRVIDGADLEVKAMEIKIAKLRELQGLQGQYRELDNTSRTLSTFVDKAVEFGFQLANGIKGARDQFKQWAIEVVQFFAKRYVLQMVASAAGGSGGSVLGGAANSAASGMENSLISTGVTAGANWLAGGSFTAAGGAGTASLFGTGALTAGGDFVGTGLAGLAGDAALAAGATDAFAASVAAAVPVIGWIVAIGAVLYMMFGSKGGAPKSGGSFNGTFDAATGAMVGNSGSRFFTPDGADSQLAAAGKGIATSYFSTLQQLGGTARGNVGFGIGFDTDPGGSAPNRISSAVTVGGRQVFSTTNRDIGRDQSQIAPEMQLEASRMVLAALQQSDLPKAVGAMLRSVAASSATQDTINNIMQGAAAVKSMLDIVGRDPMKDLATSIAQSNDRLTTAMKSNELAVRGVMGAYDGSAGAAVKLQAATVNYYNAQMQLLSQIQDIRASLGDLFGNTIRNFKLAGMDNQAKYNFYQQEAAALQQQALSSSDPETVRALSTKINADMQAAFDLLTPEQQAGAAGQAFIARGTATASAIDTHLEALQKVVVEQTTKLLTDIKTIINDAADKQVDAAGDVKAGGAAILTAAQLRENINITIPGGGNQVLSLG